MVIGRGLLARALSGMDKENYLFYANGISNSVLENISKHNFEIQEIEEIAEKKEGRLFIYFSTSQVNSEANHGRAYVKHKLYLENFIANNFANYLIVRTTNLVGNNPWNTHTLFNYLHHAITVNEQIIINPVLIRNFLDAGHFVHLLKAYITHFETNRIIEIVNPVSYSMKEIINEFEKFTNKRFNLEKTNSRDFAIFELNTDLSVELFDQCSLSTEHYIESLLQKYYTHQSVPRPIC